jgi:hypothetical protein
MNNGDWWRWWLQPTEQELRNRSIVVLLAIFLTFALLVALLYWQPEGIATKRAKEYMQHTHAKLNYRSIRTWRKWEGKWAVEFDSTPKIIVEVDRRGKCEERH